MGLKSTRAAGARALSLAAIKGHLRVDHEEEDTYLLALAEAALDAAEIETGRAIVTQTVVLTLDRFPCQIRLPRSPLASVDSISYIDSAGTPQSLASSVYRVTTASEPAVITLDRNQSWPGVDAVKDAVTVTYTAGYGADEEAIPAGLRHAMLMLIGHWYSHRESVVVGVTANAVPQSAKNLLANYKLGWHAAALSMMGH